MEQQEQELEELKYIKEIGVQYYPVYSYSGGFAGFGRLVKAVCIKCQNFDYEINLNKRYSPVPPEKPAIAILHPQRGYVSRSGLSFIKEMPLAVVSAFVVAVYPKNTDYVPSEAEQLQSGWYHVESMMDNIFATWNEAPEIPASDTRYTLCQKCFTDSINRSADFTQGHLEIFSAPQYTLQYGYRDKLEIYNHIFTGSMLYVPVRGINGKGGVLKCNKATNIESREHDTITLPPGSYLVFHTRPVHD